MTEHEVATQVYIRLTQGQAGENKTNILLPNIISTFPECRRRFIQSIKAMMGQEDKYYRVSNALTVNTNTTSISSLLNTSEPILFDVPFIRVTEDSTGSIIQYYESLTLLNSLPIRMDGYSIEGPTIYFRKYNGTNMGNVTLVTHKIPSVENILPQHLDIFIDIAASYFAQRNA